MNDLGRAAMDHVLRIDKVVDDRHVYFTGTCDCGWQFKDTAIIGYNDDSVPSGIATRHRDHVEQLTDP